MQIAAINTQFSVNSSVNPAIFLFSWDLATHAELSLMHSMGLLAMQNILLLNLDFFQDCYVLAVW